MLNIYNVRSDEQKIRMEKANKEKICPFCPEGLVKIHKLPIDKEIGGFFATKTAFPYDGTDQHYLIISKEHIVDQNKLTDIDWQDIGKVFKWIMETSKMTGGAMFWRFGDMRKNGSSVAHFHMQVISGNSGEYDPEDNRDSIKVKLGYKKK